MVMRLPRIGRRPIAIKPLGTRGPKPRQVTGAILLLLMDVGAFTAAVILYAKGKLSPLFFLMLIGTLPIFALFPALILYRYRRLYPEIRLYEDGMLLPYYQALNYRRSFIRFSDIKRFYVTEERILRDGIFDRWASDLCNDIKSDVVRDFLSHELKKISSGTVKKDMGTYIVLRDGKVLMTASRSLIGDEIIALLKAKVKVV